MPSRARRTVNIVGVPHHTFSSVVLKFGQEQQILQERERYATNLFFAFLEVSYLFFGIAISRKPSAYKGQRTKRCSLEQVGSKLTGELRPRVHSEWILTGS